jgi:bidirectional [NiFe] hydrogenase diaphorase subunit
MISFKIDGQLVEGKEGGNVLEVALDAGIEIPHLCYNESVKPYGACRLCLVEVTRHGRTKMTTSCTYPVLEGIEVNTRAEKVLRARRMMIELILAMCPGDPLIQDMAKEMGVQEVVGAHAITFYSRGDRREMGAPFVAEAQACIACGACVVVCPVNVIGMEEKGDERTIVRWKRTLKMKKCKVCGNHFAPWFQLEKFKEKAKLPKDFFDTCYTCRS